MDLPELLNLAVTWALAQVERHPALALCLPVVAGVVKLVMNPLKRRFPAIKGNLTQTVTAALSVLGMAGCALFTPGAWDASKFLAVLGGGGLAALTAMGIHSAVWDHTKTPLVAVPAPALPAVQQVVADVNLITEAEAELARERVPAEAPQ